MKIFNTNGFSMLQVVVAMALAGVLGMFVLQMQTVQTKGIKTNELQLERTNVLNRMTSLFAKRDICNWNLKDRKAGDTLTQIIQKPGVIVYSIVNDVIPNLLRINRMTIVNDGNGLLSLEVQFATSNQMVLSKETTKKIPLQTVLDVDGKIIDCYSDADNLVQTAMSMSCESLGATYDSASKKCKLTNLPQCVYVPDNCSGLYSVNNGQFYLTDHGIYLYKCCRPQ
jgi:hypothetical protein